MTYRKQLDAVVAQPDVARLKGFINNEIDYFNSLVRTFGARLRTMPEIFQQITEERIKLAVAGQIDRRDRTIPEREQLFYEELGVKRNALLIGTREAMAVELLATYRQLAEAYTAQSRGLEIPSPMEHRTKRNVQVRRQDCVLSNGSVRIPYAGSPIAVSGQVPDRWDVMVLREPAQPGNWKVEFMVKPEGYDYRLTDPAIRSFASRKTGASSNKNRFGNAAQ